MSNILFLGTEFDKPYLSFLKGLLPAGARIMTKQVHTLAEVNMYCKQHNLQYVFTTQTHLLKKLVPEASSKVETVANYAGSWLVHPDYPNITIIIVNPLKQCVTLPYGRFILERYISKVTKPSRWIETDEFQYKICYEGCDFSRLLANVKLSKLCCIDIETRKDLSMSSISFTCLQEYLGVLSTRTWVIPLPYGLSEQEYEFRFEYIRQICATDTPKLGQNMKYDIFHLLRFGCPIRNWLFDTAIAHHSWFSELKKDLSSLAAFYVRKYVFWDVESFEGDSHALYHYNALDTWNTMWAWLAWVRESPEWAKQNYKIQFPVQFPSILMECTGIAVNEERMQTEYEAQQAKAEQMRESLSVSIAVPNFNPGSSQQVQKLLTLMGVTKKGTDEKLLKKFAFKHPLNHWLVDQILGYRKAVKLSSTYLDISKLYKGVMLYSLSSYATRTGRLASNASAMWCGANIQNIPRDGSTVKKCYVPFSGFKIGEADKAQAESYCTGFISGDTVLIEAITGPQDFHSFNGAKFFGVPYEEICQNNPDGSYKILNKELRQLAKPINHGCSYNMGDGVLVDTMGLILIYKARDMLGLTKTWGAEQVAKYLRGRFAQTYKILTGQYYPWVIKQVNTFRVMVGATGWTRYCFGDPEKHKHDLNAYIAHAPQSLNAMQLNTSVYRVFVELWIPHWMNLKLCAQIHDSILFQVRDGHEYLAPEIKRIMEETSVTDVTDIFGVTRTMKIPVDLSPLSSDSWYGCKSA